MIRLVVLLLFSFVSVSCMEERVPLTVKVVDDNGNPISKVPVTVSFNERSIPGGMFGRLVSDEDTTLTNQQGYTKIRIPLHEKYGHTVFNTGSLEGYYSKSSWTYDKEVIRNYSQDNKTVVVSVPRVRNPIAAFAVSNWKWELPDTPGPWGFDFFRADWVDPHGKGLHADITMTMLDEKGDVMQWDFTGENSGAILYKEHFFGGGSLKSPYEAPVKGYQRTIQIKNRSAFARGVRDWFYVLRIQRPDVEGFYYGKSRRMIDYQYLPQHHRGTIHWSYGFNPTSGERWIEFDPSRSASRKALQEIWGSDASSTRTKFGP